MKTTATDLRVHGLALDQLNHSTVNPKVVSCACAHSGKYLASK